MTPKLVFEASEVAGFCATDVATIYTWVKKGEISHFKTPGGRLRFKRDAVLDFLRRYQFPIPGELSSGRPRVAVLDDDPVLTEHILRALHRSFDAVAYADPVDALLAIGDEKPDAIVLDAVFRGTDQMNTVRRLTAWPRLPHTRVVVFSARDDLQSAVTAAGASYVPRPAVDDLAVRLRQLLGTRG